MNRRGLLIAILIITSVFLGLSQRQTVVAQNACVEGDANGDGRITLVDYQVWRRVFMSGTPTPGAPTSSANYGPGYYVATNGNDSNSGTIDQPWRTIKTSVSKLASLPNKVLYVRGGTYNESGITIGVTGTTVAAYQGETVVVDGSYPEYRTPGNSAWMVHDAGKNIYKTAATYPNFSTSRWAAGKIEYNGQVYQLTSYKQTVGDCNNASGLDSLGAAADLFTGSCTPYYFGPGVLWNPSDKKFYIRLDPNSAAAQWNQVAPFNFPDKNPAAYKIDLMDINTGLSVTAANVTVDGIDLQHHYVGIANGGSATNINIKNLEITPGWMGIDLEGAQSWTMDNVSIMFHRAPWTSRTEVKSFPEPALGSRTTGINYSGGQNLTFKNGKVDGAFDGFLAIGGHGLKILNSALTNSMDDGIQTSESVYDFEFAYNKVLGGAGPSHDGSTTDKSPDSVYIHHNIFDNRTKVFWARKPITGVSPSENGSEGYHCAPTFSSHGVPDYDDPWKIYYNTFQSCGSPGQQGLNQWMYSGAQRNGKHEFVNNVMNLVQNGYFYRNANASTGMENYDGNVYGTDNLSFFGIEITGTNGTSRNVNTFDDWKAATGFDTHSIYAGQPIPLDANYKPAANGPAASGAIDLTNRGWPGAATYQPYRGALAP